MHRRCPTPRPLPTPSLHACASQGGLAGAVATQLGAGARVLYEDAWKTMHEGQVERVHADQVPVAYTVWLPLTGKRARTTRDKLTLMEEEPDAPVLPSRERPTPTPLPTLKMPQPAALDFNELLSPRYSAAVDSPPQEPAPAAIWTETPRQAGKKWQAASYPRQLGALSQQELHAPPHTRRPARASLFSASCASLSPPHMAAGATPRSSHGRSSTPSRAACSSCATTWSRSARASRPPPRRRRRSRARSGRRRAASPPPRRARSP